MKKPRKDKKGRALRNGETVRTDGLYQYAYTDKYGTRRYKYAKNLVELRQKEEEILRDRLDGIDSLAARTQSLNDIFDKYMSTKIGLKERTIAGYYYQYNAHVRSTIGRLKIKDIKYSDILCFYKDLMEERNLSYRTVEALHMEIRPAFEMAVRDCIIRNNPTNKVLVQLKNQTGAKRNIRKALTPEQQKVFLQFMDAHPIYDHWKPIFVFLIGTGVRVGELSGLRWCDIDFETGDITIDHAIIYFTGKMNKTSIKLYVSEPKTENSIRKIPLVKDVRKALGKIKQYQLEKGLFCKSEINGYTDFIFLNRYGTVLLQANLNSALTRIIGAYNDMELHEATLQGREAFLLPHFSCHNLRHTFCARFCEVETNMKVIQSVMGHADITTTMNIYAEVSETRTKYSMETLSEHLVLF